jgi:hypothetical protein
VENLEIAGSGRTNNGGYGIYCDNTLTNATPLEYLRIAPGRHPAFRKLRQPDAFSACA